MSNPQSVPAMMRLGSPTESRDTFETVGHHLFVLYVIGRRVDHPRDQNHLVGERMAFEAPVLVRVPGIRHG